MRIVLGPKEDVVCPNDNAPLINEFPPEYPPQPHLQDQFIWLVSRNGVYNAASTWNAIRRRSQKVSLHTLLWSPYHNPRHSFTLWLAIRGKLATKGKIIGWGMNVDPTCVLCGNCTETLQHLLFSCPFSADVRREVLKRCSIAKITQLWNEEVKWATGKLSGKSFYKTMGRIAWVALVYHIWQERNARIFKEAPSSAVSVVNNIKHEVRLKASQFPVIQSTMENLAFCNLWEIPFCN